MLQSAREDKIHTSIEARPSPAHRMYVMTCTHTLMYHTLSIVDPNGQAKHTGARIMEFVYRMSNVVACTRLPLKHEVIHNYIKQLCTTYRGTAILFLICYVVLYISKQ